MFCLDVLIEFFLSLLLLVNLLWIRESIETYLYPYPIRVYRNLLAALSYKFRYVDLVELNMSIFDVILGMKYLHSCYPSIDCRTLVFKFKFQESFEEWNVGNSISKSTFVYYNKARKHYF